MSEQQSNGVTNQEPKTDIEHGGAIGRMALDGYGFAFALHLGKLGPDITDRKTK